MDQDEIKNLIEATGTGGAGGTAENAVYDQDQSGTSASTPPTVPLITSEVKIGADNDINSQHELA